MSQLNDAVMKSFEMFPNFCRPMNSKKRVRSIHFSPDGEQLVASINNRVLELYSCDAGQQTNVIHLLKHGNSVVKYLNGNETVVVGSEGLVKGDFCARELDLNNNKFVVEYTGLKAPAVSLAVNTQKKYFMTGSLDKAALLFDFRNRAPVKSRLNLKSVPMVALHPTTDLCAMVFEDHRIELHDIRCLDYGPFCTFKLNPDHSRWNSLKFSTDANQLLMSSNSTKIRVVNSYTGALQEVFGSKFAHFAVPSFAQYFPINCS